MPILLLTTMTILIIVIIFNIMRVEAELKTSCRLCYSPRVFARDSCTCEERLSPANNLFSYSKHSYL